MNDDPLDYRCWICGEVIGEEWRKFSFDLADYHLFCRKHFDEYSKFRSNIIKKIEWDTDLKKFVYIINDLFIQEEA